MTDAATALEAADPFRVQGPAIVSFSGGRTDLARFRRDWPSGYAGIGAAVAAQRVLALDASPPATDDDGLDPFAACEGGCGV